MAVVGPWVQPADIWTPTFTFGRDYVSTPGVWIGSWNDVFADPSPWTDSAAQNTAVSVAEPTTPSPLGSLAQVWMHAEITGYPLVSPSLNPGQSIEYENPQGTYLGDYEIRVSTSAADNDAPTPNPSWVGVHQAYPRPATFPGITSFRSLCDTPVYASQQFNYGTSLGTNVLVTVMCDNIYQNDPEPTVPEDAQNSQAAGTIVGLYRPPRYRIISPGGMWTTRQRQTATGNTGGWPLRQRRNGGTTGAWPLRQRQTGI